MEEFGDEFSAKMGAEAVQDLMKQLDLDQEIATLREEIPADQLRNQDQEAVQASQVDGSV